MYFNILYFKPSLCYYFSFWVFPLIIVLWSCFLVFCLELRAKMLKIWGKVRAQEPKLGHRENPLKTMTGWRRTAYLCMFVFVSTFWLERSVCHPTCSTTRPASFSILVNMFTVCVLETKPVKPTPYVVTPSSETVGPCRDFLENSSSNFKPKHHTIGLMPVWQRGRERERQGLSGPFVYVSVHRHDSHKCGWEPFVNRAWVKLLFVCQSKYNKGPWWAPPPSLILALALAKSGTAVLGHTASCSQRGRIASVIGERYDPPLIWIRKKNCTTHIDAQCESARRGTVMQQSI